MKYISTVYLLLISITLSAQNRYSIHEMDSLLHAACTKDQTIRIKAIELNKAGSQRGFTEDIVNSLIKVSEKTKEINRKNLELVSTILKSGWPDNLKDESYKAIWTIIDHSDTRSQKKYFPILKTAADKKYIPYSDIATLKDRILMKSGKRQLYGTQSKIVISDNRPVIYIWPVKQQQRLNERRLAIGMDSIEAYIKQLESISDTKVIYDRTITIRQIKKLSRNHLKISY